MGKPELEQAPKAASFVTLGVTGHRHLFEADRLPLTQRVREFFLENFSPDDRVLVLDALAEGADQLVAEVVLDLMRSERPNLRLAAFLPMPLSFYEADFAEEEPLSPTAGELATPSPRQRFYRLLRQVGQIAELPLLAQNQELALAQKPIQRLLQYDLLGQQLALRSQLLLALWDGVSTGLKAGGSGDVVRRILTRPEGGNVFQLITPQSKKGCERPKNALETRWLSQWN